MAELPADIEQMLADLDPADWDALCARVRPPEQHPDPRVRAAAALRAHRADHGNHTIVARSAALDSTGRGRLTTGAAPSDKANAVAALRGLMSYDNSDD